MIGHLLERLAHNPAALFAESELRKRDDELFSELVNARLLRRRPLHDRGAAVVRQGRLVHVVSGPQDAIIEAIDEEDVEFEPLNLEVADISRWEFDLHGWAVELGKRLDAVGDPSLFAGKWWWVGNVHERVSLYLLLGRSEAEVRSLLPQRPTEAGMRSVIVLPPHLGRWASPQREPVVASLSDDGFRLVPTLDDLLLAPPKDGYIEPVPGFRHLHDFRSVNWNGTIFPLTTQQARVVEILLNAFLNRTPDVSQDYILEEMDVSGSALRFIFRGSEAWGRLVVSGGTNGTFRLAL